MKSNRAAREQKILKSVTYEWSNPKKGIWLKEDMSLYSHWEAYVDWKSDDISYFCVVSIMVMRSSTSWFLYARTMLIEAIGIVDPMPCCLGFVTKRKGKKGGWRLSSTCQHKGGMTKKKKRPLPNLRQRLANLLAVRLHSIQLLAASWYATFISR